MEMETSAKKPLTLVQLEEALLFSCKRKGGLRLKVDTFGGVMVGKPQFALMQHKEGEPLPFITVQGKRTSLHFGEDTEFKPCTEQAEKALIDFLTEIHENMDTEHNVGNPMLCFEKVTRVYVTALPRKR